MVRIIIDSSSDITFEKAKELELDFLPLKTFFGDREFLDGVTLSHTEFYEKLKTSEHHPTTSQIPPFEYEKVFEDVKKSGDTAVCITISSKLSGSFQSAMIAAADYTDSVVLVDSMNVAIGEQLLINLAVKLRNDGKTAGEIAEVLEQEKSKVRVLALLDTLEYLKKGGRISSTTAIAGGLLGIKPVVAVEDGKVASLGKARGSKNGQNLLREYIVKMNIDYKKECLLAYTGLSDRVLTEYVNDSQDIIAPFGYTLPVSTIGSTIGTHLGPGAIAVAFFAK